MIQEMNYKMSQKHAVNKSNFEFELPSLLKVNMPHCDVYLG